MWRQDRTFNRLSSVIPFSSVAFANRIVIDINTFLNLLYTPIDRPIDSLGNLRNIQFSAFSNNTLTQGVFSLLRCASVQGKLHPSLCPKLTIDVAINRGVRYNFAATCLTNSHSRSFISAFRWNRAYPRDVRYSGVTAYLLNRHVFLKPI